MINTATMFKPLTGYLAVFLVSVSLLQIADKVDFSGSYTLTDAKGNFRYKKDTNWTLKVVQSASAIEVTKTMGGRPESHRYPLDGTEGDFVNQFGGQGKCKGQFQGKVLHLESVVAPPNRPDTKVYKTEHWELSPDGKKLTIHMEGGFNDASPSEKQVWSEIYTRD